MIEIKTKRADKKRVELEQVIGPAEYYKSSIFWNEPIQKKNSLAFYFSHRETSGEYIFFDPSLEENSVSSNSDSEECAPEVGNGFRLRKCNRTEIDTFSIDYFIGESERYGLTLEKLDRQGLGGVKNARPNGRIQQLKSTFRYNNQWKTGDEAR